MTKKLSRTNNTILGKKMFKTYIQLNEKKSKVWAKLAIITLQHQKFYQGRLKPKNMIRNLIHLG